MWIITVINYTTCWPIAQAVLRGDVETLVDFLYNMIYIQYSVLKEILIDRGANL